MKNILIIFILGVTFSLFAIVNIEHKQTQKNNPRR